MPANKNAVLRYKFLDDLLRNPRKFYSVEEMTEKVNERLADLGYKPVQKRTIEKDLVFLQERPFSIKLERGRRNGSSYVKYADPTYSIFYQELTYEERLMLGELLNVIGQLNGLLSFTWLNSMRKSLELTSKRQILSFSSNPKLRNSNLLASLYECVANEQVISVRYQRFTFDEEENLTMYPYLLKQYNDRWYVVGHVDGDEHIFTLAVDRIKRFEIDSEKKFIPYNGDIERHFDEVIGITVFDEARTEPVLIWADDLAAKYIETKPLHSSQKEMLETECQLRARYNTPEGGRFFKLECKRNVELTQVLIHYFGDVLVLEPLDLRHEICQKLEKMQENYKKLTEIKNTRT